MTGRWYCKACMAANYDPSSGECRLCDAARTKEDNVSDGMAPDKEDKRTFEGRTVYRDEVKVAKDEIRIDPAPHAGAMKADANKNMVELLPFEALEEVGKVLTFGARKYDAHNWRKGFAWSRLLGAALRHLFSWGRGEGKDPESGLSHLAHAACCVLFLLSFEVVGGGVDDRHKETKA